MATTNKKVFNGSIGIDLGTTFSCVAVWVNDRVEIIPNESGNRTTPSWISFIGDERLVGEAAKHQAAINPKTTVYDIKRIIGKNYSDLSFQDDRQHMAFNLSCDQQDRPIVEIPITDKPSTSSELFTSNVKTRQFKLEELSAMVLAKMKQIAEDYLGQKVVNAVVTVPAYFNDAQRSATKNAVQIAGLNCLRIINEPTAACLCYGLQNKNNRNILIFDLGGGTLDVSLLEINQGIFEVRATSGNTHLGGVDFDLRLADHLKNVFEQKTKTQIPLSNLKVLRRLKDASEHAKRTLSQTTTTHVEIESLYQNLDLSVQITRATFEALCHDLFLSCLDPVKKVIVDAEIEKQAIDEVVLVGGSTRIPKVQEILSHFFDGKTLNKSVNPDEAVAHGAAVQGAILTQSDQSGRTKDLVLIDVIPLSLGIETTGGLMASIIPRNSSVPCDKASMFSTVENNQTTVLVQVFEGERKFTKDNHLLGTFELTGIPKSARGVPKIEVTFKMDANGILSVTAFEKESQVSQTATFTKDSGRLTEEEIHQMIDDAEKYKGQDELRKETVECRNAFEKYLQSAQLTVNDNEYQEALTLDERSYANQLILNTFDWLNAADPTTKEAIERTKQELIDCQRSVEYYLKPLVNKVYARQIMFQSSNKTLESTSSDSQPSIEQINQILADIGGGGGVTSPQKHVIRLKK